LEQIKAREKEKELALKKIQEEKRAKARGLMLSKTPEKIEKVQGPMDEKQKIEFKRSEVKRKIKERID